MGILIADKHKNELQGVRAILFAQPDQIGDPTILSDVYMKLAETSLINALTNCGNYSSADLRKLRRQIDRTLLPTDDPDYVSIENYDNEFGTNYDDDNDKLCLLVLALQYKLAGMIGNRKPQIVSARVLGAQYTYSTGGGGGGVQQTLSDIDDSYNDLINQLCPGSGQATASVRVADPCIYF